MSILGKSRYGIVYEISTLFVMGMRVIQVGVRLLEVLYRRGSGGTGDGFGF